METVTTTVAVPADKLGAFYQYVGGLHNEGWSRDDVEHAYAGGVSGHWRPFLRVLAAQPGQWLDWDTLCDAIKLDRRSASGMIGAAERRCRHKPPYERRGNSPFIQFRMRGDVAAWIRELAQEEG